MSGQRAARFAAAGGLVVLMAFSAAAQTVRTDVSVGLIARTAEGHASERIPLAHRVVFEVVGAWTGFGAPENVVVDIDVPGTIESISTPDETVACSKARPIRCTLSARRVTYQGTISITTTQWELGDFTAAASITTSSFDDFEANNHASLPLRVVEQPVLMFFGPYISRVEPGAPARSQVQLINAGALAQNVTATFTLPVGGRFTSATVQENAGTCEVSADRVVCNVPRVEYFKRIIFDLSYVAAERLDGADMVLRASTGEDNTADFSFWLTAHFPVTTTADEGPDSLRQALIEAREHCAERPCAIDFLVSGTIAPVSPLPEVWGRVKIDGGGKIEIDGSALPEGSDGLVLRTGCDNSVSNLTIKNVPRHAIEVHATEPATPCLLGFYYPIIAGNRLTGNERGVVQSAGSWIQIRDNVIRGNRRAGIFLGAGFYASITHNTIVENGASGIFLNLGDSSRSTVAGADVEGNVIANNGEWGLCRTPNGEVSLTDNSIYGNVSAGIDIGLDNETPNRENDGNGTPNKPELFSATYDAATGTTTIRGHIQSRPIIGGGLRIDVYASSSLSLWGYAQGEEKVGVKFLLPGSADFEVIVPRDLRGKFITATNTRSHNVGWAQPPQEQSHTNSAPGDTSEFSNAIQVQ